MINIIIIITHTHTHAYTVWNTHAYTFWNIHTHTHYTATDETPSNCHLTNPHPSPIKKRSYLSSTHSIHLLIIWSRNQLHDESSLTNSITQLLDLKREKSTSNRNSQSQHEKAHQGATNLYDAKKPGPPFFWLLAKMTLTLLPLDCQVRSGHMPQKTSLVPNSSSYTWVEDDKSLN